MSGNIILDVDIFIILCGAELLECWMDSMGVTCNQVYLLPSLKYMLRKNNSRLSRNHSTVVIDRAKQKHTNFQTLPDAADSTILSAFDCIEGIDPGERLIFAHLVSGPYRYAATNDKRSIAALAELKTFHAQLSGKIICLEQALATILLCHPWEAVNEGIQQMRSIERNAGHQIDKRLGNIFSESSQSRENTIEAVRSYCKDLEKQHSPFLAQLHLP